MRGTYVFLLFVSDEPAFTKLVCTAILIIRLTDTQHEYGRVYFVQYVVLPGSCGIGTASCLRHAVYR